MFGLAKKREEIIIHKAASVPNFNLPAALEVARKMNAYVSESAEFINIEPPKDSPAVKLLQRIRDESHRFAVSYHSTLKQNRQTSSLLDEVPGIGPLTRKKLIRHFGSAKAAINAEPEQLRQLLGAKRGDQIASYLTQLR